MNVRETLNNHRSVTVTIALVVSVASAIAAIRQLSAGRQSLMPTQAFFSADDGQSWFIDDINHVPPYEKDGKTVVRAYVFKCGTGKPFIGYLERFKASARGKVVKIMSQPAPQRNAEELQGLIVDGREVKKPGAPQWVDANGRQGVAVTTPAAPDGQTGIVEAVFP